MTRYARLLRSLIIAPAIAMASAAIALAADPFTVRGVPVDASAPSATEAQTQAIGQGQLAAARRLVERLTLESERAAKGVPDLTPEVVGPLIRGLTIDNERRSATRYLGDVSIAFNPSAVQQLLRSSGLTMVSSQAQPRVVMARSPLPESVRTQLRAGRYAHALTPLVLPPDGSVFVQNPLDAELAVQISGGQTALVIDGGPGAYTATEYVMGGSGAQEMNRYSFSSLDRLVAQLERDFKQTAAVPSDSQSSQTVSVLYSSLGEWQQLQRAINTSAQVRDARLDAVSKDGALMTLTYGSLDRLAAEMRQKGVRVEQDPKLGLVIRR